jgi:hypothetical protein
MREEEIFTTAASAGFNTGAKPSALGGAASTLFPAATTTTGNWDKYQPCFAHKDKPAPLRPPKINTPEIAATAIERRICNVP